MVEGRTDAQCKHRWTKVLQPGGMVKGVWKKEVGIHSVIFVKLVVVEKWVLPPR